jgi:hypothetical protein
MSDEKFDLWLEFEHWGPAGAHGPEDDFFNMQVRLPDGRCYALNVWTFKFLERARREDVETGEGLSGKYMLPPDLFVARLERDLVTQTIADLIRRQGLKDEWLVRES